MRVSIVISLLILTIASAGKINGPVKAIYIDYLGINWGNPTIVIKDVADAGYNLIILAFYLNSGPADMAYAWSTSDDAAKRSAIAYAHSKGAYVTVSTGGATDSPYAASAVEYGTKAAQFAQKHYLDGVDFDMENFDKGLTYPGKSSEQIIQWLADATNAARKILGDKALITHAPQAPYFGKIGGGAGSNPWTQSAGGYTAVYKKASTIDYFLVQFYNQGVTCYTNYKGIFENSSDCPAFPGTSVKEIASYGIPLDKIVLGKPVRQGDANNGLLSANQLNTIVKQARLMGWNAGVMGWVWSSKAETGAWIQSIYPSSTNAPVTSIVPAAPATKTATPVAASVPVTKPASSAPVAPKQNITAARPTTTVHAAPQQTKATPEATPVPQHISTPVATPSRTAAVTASPKPAPSTQSPSKGSPSKGSCVSADPTKATDAWCKSVNCLSTHVKAGLCKLA